MSSSNTIITVKYTSKPTPLDTTIHIKKRTGDCKYIICKNLSIIEAFERASKKYQKVLYLNPRLAIMNDMTWIWECLRWDGFFVLKNFRTKKISRKVIGFNFKFTEVQTLLQEWETGKKLEQLVKKHNIPYMFDDGILSHKTPKRDCPLNER